MGIVTDEDMAMFVEPEDFGTAGVYTPVSGESVEVNVIFVDPELDSDMFGRSVENTNTYVMGRMSDIGGAVHEETITIDGTVYYIKAVKPDGTGMCTVELSKTKLR